MATHAISPGGPSSLPLSLIAQAARKLTRHELEALTERLIEELDRQDGDPDVEDDCDQDTSVDDFPCDAIDEDAGGYEERLFKPVYGIDQREIRNAFGTFTRLREDY